MLFLSGWDRGANSNTTAVDLEITDTLMKKLGVLAYKLPRFDIYNTGGNIFYDEEKILTDTLKASSILDE